MRSIAFVVATVVCLHAGLWAVLRGEATAPDVIERLASVSYAPFAEGEGAKLTQDERAAQIRSDMARLERLTKSVRTYSSTDGAELTAGIAGEFGMKATVGAWIDKNEDRNEREIANAVEVAKRHSNVQAVMVGNESILRGEKTADEIVQLMRRVKRQVGVPVTTGETWDVWIDHPELASAADYIAAHILPYWEGVSAASAVDQAEIIYNRLREAYPGKRIVIAEFGWPSAGHNRRNAVPGAIEQGEVIRKFVFEAEQNGLEYNIIEAIDQPWKSFEGSVGAYWGLLDVDRNNKFQWVGPLVKHDHWKLAALALALSALLSVPILALPSATVGQAAFLAAGSNMAGAWLANVVAFWQGHYFVPAAAFAFLAGVMMLVPLVLIVLARLEEIAAVAFGRRPQRLISPEEMAKAAPAAGYAPKVSIHIPAYREPPEMLIRTLESVAALEYPSLECIVVINNTPEERFWGPVKARCEELGSRFTCLVIDRLEGFKAGAMRIALEHTAADAEIIGVIDADYAVRPDWLKALVPVFSDSAVGLVQAPQEHRDGHRSPLHTAMNAEYAGFFDIGMVQRNEANAIVVHGTMCLIRRTALIEAGNWSSDTICEDTDLGLSLIERGWHIHYTNERYGEGLLPDTFEQFKKQRHRWAYGGVQIIKKHLRRFLTSETHLTPVQKREFALGWAGWLGAEALGVAVALMNLVMVPLVLFWDLAVPERIMSVPIVASFLVSLLHFTALYRLRCKQSLSEMAGALLAAMSVQWTIAKAVGDGLIKDNLPFNVTAKGGARKRQAAFQARAEAAIGVLLASGAWAIWTTNWEQVREFNVYAIVLLLQSLPFLSAAAISLFEGSRLNDFAYWSALGSRVRALAGRSALPAIETLPEKKP